MHAEDLNSALHLLAANAVREAVQPAVAAALAEALPELLRRAALPVVLTRKQVMEMTGWSARKLAYLQAKGQIPFVKRGRSVLFRTVDIEDYLGEGYVPAKSAGRATSIPKQGCDIATSLNLQNSGGSR